MTYAVSGAILAPSVTSSPRKSRSSRFRLVFLSGLLALTFVAIEAPAATQAHSPNNANTHHRTEAQRVVAYAKRHIGARFRLGSEGPRYFDCSGLIYRVYKQAGLLNRVGGARRLAAGYYFWFKHHGMASRHNPKVGDLVIWKEKGKIAHSGIYVGRGHVISALINPWGVKRTHINTIHARFFMFLHVRLQR